MFRKHYTIGRVVPIALLGLDQLLCLLRGVLILNHLSVWILVFEVFEAQALDEIDARNVVLGAEHLLQELLIEPFQDLTVGPLCL